MAEPMADQVLRKIGERQAKAIECLTPFAKFYGNHPREARSYAA
jgi:hypothetical protein